MMDGHSIEYTSGAYNDGGGSGRITVYETRRGHRCYNIKAVTGGAEYTVDGKEYIDHQDGTWTCPGGSTWTRPDSCTSGCYMHQRRLRLRRN